MSAEDGAGCVFCRIVAYEEPAVVVEDFLTAIAIEPLYPVTPGHTLVIPKVHVPNAGANPTVTGSVFALAAIVAGRFKAYNLITSVGAPATQSIPHFHVHIVPRVPGDLLPLPWSHPDTLRRRLDSGARAEERDITLPRPMWGWPPPPS